MTRYIKQFACILTLALILTLTASAKIQLADLDQMTDYTGGVSVEVVSSSSEHIEGDGALRSSSSELIIVQVQFMPANIDAYALDGGLHFWLYLEDADALNGNGQIELTSSGTCDIEETTWNIYDVAYEDGWNEVWLPFYNCSQDAMNYYACNYFRIYNFVDYDTYMIVDDISVGMREDFPTLDSDEKPYDKLVETEAETKAPLMGNIDDHEGEDEALDDEEYVDEGYAGLDGAGAIEDRVEEESATGNNPLLYVGVVVFSSLCVIATAFVVFVRKYKDEEPADEEPKQDE